MENIEFYSTFKGTRPIRLSEPTRRFAYDSLQGKYGCETKDTMFVTVDDIEGFDRFTPYQKYDAMIKRIAEAAPIRICKGELLSGSAALGASSLHLIPVQYNNDYVMSSISHLTCNFDRVVREGLDSYRDRIVKRMSEPASESETAFLNSLMNVYDSCRIYHERVLAELKKRKMFEQYSNLKDVPFKKPKNFKQAIQSVWFAFAFIRLCGNWPGIGRLDLMLGDYLKNDLESETITLKEAREYMAHFFIKGCEWIKLDGTRNSGDAQHYQNLVIGGIDENGEQAANEVTKLILETVEEFPISDFPIAVRINDHTPKWLIRKIAEVMRHGSGVVAVYNENLIIDSMVELGYKLEEARQFANDGCWEVQVPGKTCFAYNDIDIYRMFEDKVLGLYNDNPVNYDNFEEMYSAFSNMLSEYMAEWHSSYDTFAQNGAPMSVIALFEDDCIENAKDYHNGGARYNSASPHLSGVPDLANCMYAIQKLVWEEKKATFSELTDILKANWEGHEELRLYARNSYVYFGNDNDEVDMIVARIMEDFVSEVRKVKIRNNIFRPAGISTFGRQIDWKDMRKASAHGFKSGDILASNLSPTPSTDKKGATAVIRSHCKSDLSKFTCGVPLDLKLDPSSVKGDSGLEAIEALILGFIKLGGIFLQIDVLDNSVLLEAQKHPENYKNLSVRISGWSARFVTLNDDWQQMIIERTVQQQ